MTAVLITTNYNQQVYNRHFLQLQKVQRRQVISGLSPLLKRSYFPSLKSARDERRVRGGGMGQMPRLYHFCRLHG